MLPNFLNFVPGEITLTSPHHTLEAVHIRASPLKTDVSIHYFASFFKEAQGAWRVNIFTTLNCCGIATPCTTAVRLRRPGREAIIVKELVVPGRTLTQNSLRQLDYNPFGGIVPNFTTATSSMLRRPQVPL